MHLELHQTLHHAVDKGIEVYITSRRARIPIFIAQHFSFRGAFPLHRKTFGRDVYKYPVNLRRADLRLGAGPETAGLGRGR